jgi:hypothetical protein
MIGSPSSLIIMAFKGLRAFGILGVENPFFNSL